MVPTLYAVHWLCEFRQHKQQSGAAHLDTRVESDYCKYLQLRTVLQDKRPANTTYGYDFRETSAASHDTVVRKVRKPDFGTDMDATGACCTHFTSLALPLRLCLQEQL